MYTVSDIMLQFEINPMVPLEPGTVTKLGSKDHVWTIFGDTHAILLNS